MATFQIDKTKAALLVMDFQAAMIAMQPEDLRQALLDHTRTALEAARSSALPVVFVTVRFREGYPEVSPRNKRFSAMKAAGRLLEGSPSVQFPEALAPLPGEPIVVKRQVSALAYTDLEAILRARDVTTLILCGLSTSGVVLSTVRAAADMNYEMIVLGDCCSDPNPELHQVLMRDLFPSQAIVATVEDLVAALR